MKDKILQHFQTEYEVSIGHPIDKNGPSTNLMYFIVRKKDGTNSRGEIDDDEFVRNFLNEIGIEYNTELFMLVLQTSNKFIESLTKNRLGIHL